VDDLAAMACQATTCAWVSRQTFTEVDPATLKPRGQPLPLQGSVHRITATENGFRLEGTCGAQPCVILVQPGVGDAPPNVSRIEASTGAAGGTPVAGQSPSPSSAPGPAAGNAPLGSTAADNAPPGSTAADAMARSLSWNRIIERHWRVPFQKTIPSPGGGVITWLRGVDVATARLMRVGHGLVEAPAAGSSWPITCTGWLALHPTGSEFYLLTWPSSRIFAYDPSTLTKRWSLDLGAPAVGLFLDPSGRFLLVGLSDRPDPERLSDWEVTPRTGEESSDPAGDGVIDLSVLPPIVATELVDIAGPTTVVRADGAFRAWIALPDGARLLATDREVVRLEPGPPAASKGAGGHAGAARPVSPRAEGSQPALRGLPGAEARP
jgi:hypothetical protein